METSEVLDEMFAKYKPISLEDIASVKGGKEICVEGYITEYLDQYDGFFMSLSKDQKERGEDVTLKYVPRIGISLKKIAKLCDIVKEHNPKITVYGELIQEKEHSAYRELEIHAIEFEANGKKFRYPNAEMIEGDGDKKPMPYIGMDGIDQQVVEKEFRKIHSTLNTLDILNTVEGELTQKEKEKSLTDFSRNLINQRQK